jgi:hypothetical protein
MLMPDDIANPIDINIVPADGFLLARTAVHNFGWHQCLGSFEPFIIEFAVFLQPQRPQKSPVGSQQVGNHGQVRALYAIENNCRAILLKSDAGNSIDFPFRIDLLFDVHDIIFGFQEF